MGRGEGESVFGVAATGTGDTRAEVEAPGRGEGAVAGRAGGAAGRGGAPLLIFGGRSGTEAAAAPKGSSASSSVLPPKDDAEKGSKSLKPAPEEREPPAAPRCVSVGGAAAPVPKGSAS